MFVFYLDTIQAPRCDGFGLKSFWNPNLNPAHQKSSMFTILAQRKVNGLGG